MRDLATGDFKFGGQDHYWAVVDDNVIIDSPGPDQIVVATAEQREGVEYIPLSIIALDKLRPLSDATCRRVLNGEPPEGWPDRG